MYKEIFEKLKFAYILSDKEICEKLNISPDLYQKMLEAKQIPYDLLIKIKETFKLSLDFLISGNPTKEDEKILNRQPDKNELDKLMFPHIGEIKRKIFNNGFGKYWEGIESYMYTSYFEKSHGQEPITFSPWGIFRITDLDLWDFFKSNFYISQHPVSSSQYELEYGMFDKILPNHEKTWENFEIFLIKCGYAPYEIQIFDEEILAKKNKRNIQNEVSKEEYEAEIRLSNQKFDTFWTGSEINAKKGYKSNINPKWINRCLNVLNGEKLEIKKITNGRLNMQTLGPTLYSQELNFITSQDPTTWNYELIDKILKIGGTCLKQVNTNKGLEQIELVPDYVMTEFIKNLVEKNLKK